MRATRFPFFRAGCENRAVDAALQIGDRLNAGVYFYAERSN
jgi:hypothetical protein